MRRFVFAFIFLILASPALAVISVDVASTGTGTSSTSYSHTLNASANIIIVCVQSYDNAGTVLGASAVTVGGAAATQLTAQTNSGGVVRTELWYKLAPLTGAQTIAATGDATTDKMVTGSISFLGVAQSSTFNTLPTALNANVSNADVVAIASAVGEMGVMCGASQQATTNLTSSADAATPVSTSQFSLTSNAQPNGVLGFGYTEAGAATLDMKVDLNVSINTAGVAVSMRPFVIPGTGMKTRKAILFQ